MSSNKDQEKREEIKETQNDASASGESSLRAPPDLAGFANAREWSDVL